MSKVKMVLLTLISSTLFLLATISSAFACMVWMYQPETPKSLIR